MLPSPIELSFPAEDRFVDVAQLVAGRVAMACGLPVEEAEDLRLLVDELCEALIDTSGGASIRLVFTMDGSRLLVEASAEQDEQLGPDRFALGEAILGVLADSHERVVSNGRLLYRVARDLRSGGVG